MEIIRQARPSGMRVLIRQEKDLGRRTIGSYQVRPHDETSWPTRFRRVDKLRMWKPRGCPCHARIMMYTDQITSKLLAIFFPPGMIDLAEDEMK